MLNEFLLALQFLTIIQIKKTLPFDERSFGRSAAFFPLVGAILGTLVWGIDIALQNVVPLALRNLILVAVLAILSRGLHFDGLADSADGLFGSHDRERRLAIMKDSRIGTFGTLALLGVVLFKVRALDLLSGSDRNTALLLGPVLSRWAYVVIAYRAIPARQDGLGVLLVRGVVFRELAVASGVALLVTLFIGGMEWTHCYGVGPHLCPWDHELLYRATWRSHRRHVRCGRRTGRDLNFLSLRLSLCCYISRD